MKQWIAFCKEKEKVAQVVYRLKPNRFLVCLVFHTASSWIRVPNFLTPFSTLPNLQKPSKGMPLTSIHKCQWFGVMQ